MLRPAIRGGVDDFAVVEAPTELLWRAGLWRGSCWGRVPRDKAWSQNLGHENSGTTRALCRTMSKSLRLGLALGNPNHLADGPLDWAASDCLQHCARDRAAAIWPPSRSDCL